METALRDLRCGLIDFAWILFDENVVAVSDNTS